MKLWIDAQLPPGLAKWIAENFASIEATAVRDLGLREAEDQVIFFSARKAGEGARPERSECSSSAVEGPDDCEACPWQAISQSHVFARAVFVRPKQSPLP